MQFFAATPLMKAIQEENVNAMINLLRHPRIDVSVKVCHECTAIEWAEQNQQDMVPIIQQEMCDFIGSAHKDEAIKRKQFMEHIPKIKECGAVTDRLPFNNDGTKHIYAQQQQTTSDAMKAKDGLGYCILILETRDTKQLLRVKKKIKEISHVISLERL